MSEQRPLKKSDIMRDRESYTVADIAHFAHDILLKDKETSDSYGDNPGKRVSWYVEGSEVALLGHKLNEPHSVFQVSVSDHGRINGRHIYVISDKGSEGKSIVALYNESHEQINTAHIENSITVMNILRTHPEVAEPLMNEQGRARLEHIQKMLALVVGTDKELPRAQDDTQQ